MSDNFTVDELERMYTVEKRNSVAYRQALERIVAYCGEKCLKIKGGGTTTYLMQISRIAQSAMTATGEIPLDGFKR